MKYIIGIYLFIVSIEDIRYKRVSLWILVTAAAAGVIYSIYSGLSADILISILPGVVLCILSRLCSCSIGLADGILTLIYGIFYGWRKTIIWLMFSFVLVSITGAISSMCVALNKKQLPFVPFMFLSHIGMCI